MLLEQFSVARAGKALFAPVSLEVSSGLQLIAANGAGKSTALQALAGLRRYEGKLTLPSGGVHYLGHRNGYYPTLTVLENLRLAAKIAGSTDVDAACTQAMIDWQLSNLDSNQPLHCLSAGQQRRAGLARLSLVKRTTWLLDEPQAHLDPQTTALLFANCQTHCTAGGIVVISAHQDLTAQHALPWLIEAQQL